MNIDIFHAVENNNMTEIQEYINNGGDVNIRSDDADELTPLHWACCFDHYNIIDFLLKNGAGINIKDEDGNIPLHFVCCNDHCDIAYLLLKNGSDTNIRTCYGWTPLYSAYNRNNYNIINLLLSFSKEEDRTMPLLKNFWRTI